MNYTIYRIATGQIVARTISPAGAPQAPDGCAVLPDTYGDPRTERVVNGEVVPKALPSIEVFKATAKAIIAQRRWETEVGGITFNGVTIATDDRSKLLLSAAAARARADENFTTNWKTSSGFTPVDAATLIAIEDAVFAHVANAFAWEDMKVGAIEAAADAAAVQAILDAE